MDFIFIILLFLINQLFVGRIVKTNPFLSRKLLNRLFVYHFVFLGIYMLYAANSGSDSFEYYKSALEIGSNLDFTYTGTRFIDNFSAFFIQFGLSYTTMMILYAWFGYVGFVYAYLFFRENITVPVTVFGKYNLLTLLLFLPNMHFWTVSLGKGSLIFMGLMIFTYAVKIPKKRFLLLIIGGFFVYMIRPAVMLFVLVGVLAGLLTGKQKMSPAVRFIVIIGAIGFLYVARTTILGVANLENSENVVDDFQKFSTVASDRLEGSAGSGVSMNSYPLPLKLFTFWFRPLFFDSPSILGIFSSAENLVYLLLFLKICNRRFIKFIRRAPYMVKMSAITFLLSSFALTFIMSNLGIIMRQKSMVMYFGFFVIYYFLANEEWLKMQKKKAQTTVSIKP
ncbi:MAG: hypothetical protein V4535_08060 [Bacteroidota bacterium]